jgi:hypothetical protein
MPFEDPTLKHYPKDESPQGQDSHGAQYGAEGTGIAVWSSSREDAFWIKFMQEHPKPPEVAQDSRPSLRGQFGSGGLPQSAGAGFGETARAEATDSPF